MFIIRKGSKDEEEGGGDGDGGMYKCRLRVIIETAEN